GEGRITLGAGGLRAAVAGAEGEARRRREEGLRRDPRAPRAKAFAGEIPDARASAREQDADRLARLPAAASASVAAAGSSRRLSARRASGRFAIREGVPGLSARGASRVHRLGSVLH